MSDCSWTTVEAFDSMAQYRALVGRLESEVAEGRAQQVPLDPSKAWGNTFKERWFKCVATGGTWRLVAPDPPFPGVFDRM